ncbi:hypothetical protein HHL16_00195 [Pseudoflavitalea sp. G-6-1-2]|uniref:hypothetical protein n=1 Tax=Pseudoflavitalea sp. G-6-1-2 TaxID=2728841 RepID=UPI00146CBFB5|nr:hypothetical protein [Pseudoflavitalea sp. G-6-1-2]NML19264.1 hypothetical protein [Pseudoflavitalea sp. G-6-1-2]
MKQSFFLLLLAVALFACKKESQNDIEFRKSYSSWLSFKKTSGDHYKYDVETSSWTGFASKTVIWVRNSKVIQRHYKVTQIGSTMYIPPSEMEWIENENEINSHKNKGAAAITLDEVYDKAQKDWLIRRDNTEITFEAKNNGMISTCGYRELSCADDCFNGIKITRIQSMAD